MMISLLEAEQHVGRMVTMSTAHLTPELREELDVTERVIAYPLPYGYLMLVRPETGEELEEVYSEMPDEVVIIQEFARMMRCEWVRFDRDADAIEALPIYE